MKKISNPNMNKYIISFLIYTITLFGVLGFIFEKVKVDSWTNYYTIFASGAAIFLLIVCNLSEFKWKNIRKVPLILSLISILWIIISSFFGIRFGIEALKGIVNYSCLLVLAFVIMNISLSKEDIEFIFKSIFISFFICMMVGIFQYFSGINLIQYSNFLYPGILGRINSTFFIATILDKYIVLIEILLIYYLIKQPKMQLQLLLVLSGIGVGLTFSRGGQLAFVFFIMIFLFLTIWKKQYSNIIAIFITLIIMYLIPGVSLSFQSGLNFIYNKIDVPSNLRIVITFINQLYKKVINNDNNSSNDNENIDNDNSGNQSTGEEANKDKNTDEKDDIVKEETNDKSYNEDVFGDDLSVLSREKYKAVGLQIIKDYPIFGIGVGNYSYLYNNQNFDKFISDQSVLEDLDEIRYPHNGFIQVAAEMGYIGLTFFCLTLLSYIYYVDYKKDKLKLFTEFLLFVALVLASYTETVFNCKQYIFLFVIFISFLSCKSTKIIENKKN